MPAVLLRPSAIPSTDALIPVYEFPGEKIVSRRFKGLACMFENMVFSQFHNPPGSQQR